MRSTLLALSLGALTLLGGEVQAQATGSATIPTQTYFVPLPEKDLFDNTFEVINSVADGNVNSIVAIAISTAKTIVWYDQQEDGYESNYLNSSSFKSSTQIWGDGNCANGYVPGTSCTKGSDDVLKAGQSIVLVNDVAVTAGANNGFKYGGGDKILASYPIAITRGAYPDNPGSLMAGGVEVLDTAEWGTFYVVPTGQNVNTGTSMFEHTAVYIMAQQDGTVVTTSDGKQYTLNAGKSATHVVNTLGLTLTSTAPVQVDIITGDKGSTYQLRWFALFPRNAWTNSYFSPVGDTTGGCKIYLYNPSGSTLNVTISHSDQLDSSSKRLYPKAYSVLVGGSSFAFTNVIPKGTGAALTASSPFIALSITDTVGGGQIYDWGFPVLPSNKMTERVLIGWGYGCTDKDCKNNQNSPDGARSVVWVSPWADADIYVDINNDGIPESSKSVKNVKRLSSIIVQNGADLSGAVIWAVKPGENCNSSNSVPIAAAWGQNSEYSFSGDNQALDLGTLVPPFIGVRVDEVVALSVDKDGDGMISPGDVVEYTIQVQNAGQKNYGPCDYRIKDPAVPANLPRQTYLNGTCVFVNNGVSQPCLDAPLNGGDGLCSPASLPQRGGVHYYKFKATIGGPEKIDNVAISDQGTLTQVGLGPILPFSAQTVINFRPSINIEKTVFKGTLATCSNGAEIQEGRPGEIVTYCYEVKNTGNSYLSTVVVTDAEVGFLGSTPINLAPGEVQFVKFQSTIPNVVTTTNGTVTATPVLVNGQSIPTYKGGQVTDTDSAGVKPLPYTSSISVKKYAGPPGSGCNTAAMNDDTFLATTLKFEYCYVINVTGDECVTGVTLGDSSVGGIASRNIGTICSNNATQKINGTVTTTKTKIPSTNVTVSGTGQYSKAALTSRDPAAVDIPTLTPVITIKKYAGPVNSKCNITAMKDDTYSPTDTTFEYCYIITNTGNECIINGTLTDTAVGGLNTKFDKLCNNGTALKYTGNPSSSLVDIASTPGTVTGKGEYSETAVSASDPAAIDIPNYTPSLEIKKYAGPVGSRCNITAMQDNTYVAPDLQFEYCYVIKNLGNECILNLTMTDSALGGIASKTIPKLCLADGPYPVYGNRTTTTTDVPSTPATVKGTGQYSNKTITASDPAAVDVPDYKPSLKIKKYAGPPDSDCDLQVMQDDTYVAKDTTIFAYCYVITNDGNECVVNATFTDPAVGGIKNYPAGKICPGDEPKYIAGTPTFIEFNIPSTDAVLTGTGQYTGVPVTAKDPAAVEYVPPVILNIALTIEKTVHLGNIPTCFDGSELEYGFSGTVVTYCYKVTNPGEVPLEVVVTDGPVGTNEKFLLTPGLSTWVKKVSSITADLTSDGVAVGKPTDAEKTVTAKDPAGVKLVPVKPVCE